MMTYNRVKLVGHVGAMPFVKYTSPTTCIARLSLATNREGYTDDEGRQIVGQVTEWHSVICYNAVAQEVETEVRTGTAIEVEGCLTYEEICLASGERVKSARVEAERIQILSQSTEEEQVETSKEKPTNPYGKYLDTLSRDAESGDLPF